MAVSRPRAARKQPAAGWTLPACALLLCCLAAAATRGAAQPGAPTAPPAGGYTVSATATLAGLSAAAFTSDAEAAFTASLASTLGVDSATVAVTGVTDGARRRLLDSSAAVAFAVTAADAAASTAVAAAVTAVSADPTAFVAALNNALAAGGLPPCTGAVVSAPTVAGPPLTSLSSAYTVSSTATLGGVSAGAFGAPAQAAFSTAMAAALQVEPGAVAVTGVTDVARRRLLQDSSGAAVAFTVSVESASGATGVAAAITAIASDASAFVTALNAALASGGMAPCTGVVVSAPVVEAPPALNLSDIDVSAVVTELTGSFDSLTDDEAAELQTQLLTTIAASTTGVTLTADAVSAAAALVLAVVSAAPGVLLSADSQTAALNILLAVCAASIDATGTVGQSVVSTLDSVAMSAAGSDNPAPLVTVQLVIGNLASALASSLLETLYSLSQGDPPPAPVAISSPSVRLLVQVDPPSSDRLTTQPLSAPGPGNTSIFQPMPADVLPTDVPIVTVLYSVSFDPYDSSATTFSITGGMTHLGFYNTDGSTIAVADLSTPVVFSLPEVQLALAGDTAACMSWDEDAAAYSTVGCLTLPTSIPPNHNVSFVPGFEATDDTQLAAGWSIDGPLTSGCASAAQQPSQLVFSGDSCELLQPENAYDCSWSNELQSFQGSGCVAVAGPALCMCRHVRGPSAPG